MGLLCSSGRLAPRRYAFALALCAALAATTALSTDDFHINQTVKVRRFEGGAFCDAVIEDPATPDEARNMDREGRVKVRFLNDGTRGFPLRSKIMRISEAAAAQIQQTFQEARARRAAAAQVQQQSQEENQSEAPEQTSSEDITAPRGRLAALEARNVEHNFCGYCSCERADDTVEICTECGHDVWYGNPDTTCGGCGCDREDDTVEICPECGYEEPDSWPSPEAEWFTDDDESGGDEDPRTDRVQTDEEYTEMVEQKLDTMDLSEPRPPRDCECCTVTKPEEEFTRLGCGHSLFCKECMIADINRQARNSLKVTRIECPLYECKRRITVQEVHGILSAEDYKKYTTMVAKFNEMIEAGAVKGDAALEQWKKENTKPCPGEGCSKSLEKNEGCNHMTCAVCRCEFCWTCGGPYRPDFAKTPYSGPFPNNDCDATNCFYVGRARPGYCLERLPEDVPEREDPVFVPSPRESAMERLRAMESQRADMLREAREMASRNTSAPTNARAQAGVVLESAVNTDPRLQQVNGFYQRRESTDGPPLGYNFQDLRDWEEQTAGRPWYEKDDGYFICWVADSGSFFAEGWVCRDVNSRFAHYYVARNTAEPPTEGWREATTIPEFNPRNTPPTLRVVS